jgi:hypothetical protein
MRWPSILVSLWFFAYAVLRAVRVGLTYDEAAAFFRYIATDVPSVFNTGALSVFSFEVATNHFLNTVLTKVCCLLAGDSEFVLRIPSLIGFAVYLFFSWSILRRFTRPAVALPMLALLNLNPYLLDFFALSRGYSLGLGFLMGAVFFLIRLVDRAPEGIVSRGDIVRVLAFAAAAVMANLALLNVYVAVFLVVVVAVAASSRVPRAARRAPREDEGGRPPHRRRFPWLVVVAPAFAVLVLSQDAGLSNGLYEDVSMRLVGPAAADTDRLRVYRLDLRGREKRLARDNDSTAWRSTPGAPFTGVRIDGPPDAVARLSRIELVIGHRAFSDDPLHGGWISRDAGTTHVFDSGPSLSLPRSRMRAFQSVINWAGDGRYAARVAQHTAIVMALLAGLGGVLWAIGVAATRARLLDPEHRSTLAAGILWPTALAGLPLYLLKRDGELYYGGTQGLVHDTFYSVIENSFYGREYLSRQTDLAFACALAIVAAFCVVLAVHYRRGRLPRTFPAIAVLALMVLTAVAIVAEHVLFGTVYPAGRTALFYAPLFVLFTGLFCEALADLGRAGTAGAIAVLAIVLTLSTWHFIETANLTYTLDWRHDASTKTMMRDLRQIVAADRGPESPVVLGVAPLYAPVAAYYARRTPAPIVNLVPLPAGGIEFLYGPARDAGPGAIVLRTYPFTRTVLAKAGTAAR